MTGDRDALKVSGAQQPSAHEGTSGNGQRDRAPSREWNQEESRREQAARARDQREQQDRQQRSRQPDFLFENL